MGLSLIGEKEKEWSQGLLSSPVGKGSRPSPSGPVTKLKEDAEDAEDEERISPSHSQHPEEDLMSSTNGSPPAPIPPLHLGLRRGGDEDLVLVEDADGDDGGERGMKRILLNNETRIPRSSALFSSQDPSLLPHSSPDKQGKGEQGNISHHQPTILPKSCSSNWNSSNRTNILSLYPVSQNQEFGHGEYGLPSPTPPPRSANTLNQHKSTNPNTLLNNGRGTDGKWSSRRRLKLRLDMESHSPPPVPSLVIPVKGSDSPGGTSPPQLNQNTKTGETLEGGRWTSNSVTLPVPSPPSASILHSPFPYSVDVDLDVGRVGGVSPRTRSRRLISREAQTEESSLVEGLPPPPPPHRNREQRKRERRERRQNRLSISPSPGQEGSEGMNGGEGPPPNQPMSPPQGNSQIVPVGLGDIPPPPYSTLPPDETGRRSRVHPLPVSSPPNPPLNLQNVNVRRERREVGGGGGGGVEGPLNPPPSLSIPSPTQPLRYHFSHPQTSPHILHTLHSTQTEQTRRSFRAPRGIPYASEEEPKSCCGMSTSQAVSIRWFIIVIAGIGICSTVAGTALGAARSAGSQHLTLALLMIGVGVVLLTVSAVAWRLTANESGSSSCRAMLGFGRSSGSRGDGGSEPNRVFVPRLPPSYGRPHHPYAAMLYPDFQYRPPPPSYQASMQEYRLRLLLLERSNPNLPHVTHVTGMGSGTDTGFPPTHQLQISHPPPPYRPYNQNNQNQTVRPGTTSRGGVPPPYGRRVGAALGGRIGGLNLSPTQMGPIDGNENGPVTWTHAHPDLSREGQEGGHGRDSSILSYLSHHSLSEESSEGIGHGNPSLRPGVTLMEVNVELGIGQGWSMDDQLPMTPEDEVRVAKEVSSVSPLSPLEEGGGGDEKNKTRHSLTQVGLGGEGEKSKDGNLVRIVQTTDSSQVIGTREIVTVSGNQHNLVLELAQHSHHPPIPISVPVSTPVPNNNQVQILAHL